MDGGEGNVMPEPSTAGAVRKLELRFFGGFSVAVNGQQSEPPAARKSEELVVLLTLARTRSATRESIATALWPESSAGAAKKQLRQALWHVHNALDASGVETSRFLVADHDRVAVNPAVSAWVDATAFDQTVSRLAGVPGRDLDGDHLRRLAQACSLYAGPLLDGCYADWCLVERERYENAYLMALDKLVSAYEALGRFEEAIAAAGQILLIDPAHERSHRRLMRLHFFNHDRTSALRQYDRCTQALGRELGVAPTRRTVALAEAIRADEPDLAAPPPIRGSVTMAEVAAELVGLRHALDGLQTRLDRWTMPA